MAFHYLGMQVADIFSIVRLDASNDTVIAMIFVMLSAMLGILVCFALALRHFRISDERAEDRRKRQAKREADHKEILDAIEEDRRKRQVEREADLAKILDAIRANRK